MPNAYLFGWFAAIQQKAREGYADPGLDALNEIGFQDGRRDLERAVAIDKSEAFRRAVAAGAEARAVLAEEDDVPCG